MLRLPPHPISSAPSLAKARTSFSNNDFAAWSTSTEDFRRRGDEGARRVELGYQRDDPEIVRIIFIGEGSIPVRVQDALMTWWTTTFAEEPPADLVVLEPEFTTYAAMDVQRYKRLEQFDISRLSPPE